MKRIVAALLSLCVGVSVLVQTVQAIPPSPPPDPWEVEFEEYGRIFFMTPTEPDWNVEYNIERYGEERMQIPSGLYYNTDPLVNIYRVYEYVRPDFGMQVWFSSDGQYFVRINRITSREMSHDVLSFFAGGQRVASYAAEDLVRSRRALQRFSTLYTWVQSGELDQELGILIVETVESRTFTFDMATGEIISQTGGRTPVLVIVAAGVVALTAAIVLARRNRRIFLDRK